MKKKFNITVLTISFIITLIYMFAININNFENKVINIEKINGKFSELGNVKIKTLTQADRFHANKFILDNSGKVSKEKVKYDYYRDVGEEVLQDKSLFRDSIELRNSIVSENEKFKVVIGNKEEQRFNMSSYKNTLNISCKDKDTNSIKKFNVELNCTGNIDLIYSTIYKEKVYLIFEHTDLQEKDHETSISLAVIDVNDKSVVESKNIAIKDKRILESVGIFQRDEKIYIPLVDRNLEYNKTVNLTMGAIDINTLEFNSIDYGIFENKDYNLRINGNICLEDEKLFMIVDINNDIENINESKFIIFDLNENKFKENKEVKINNGDNLISISDFMVDGNNMIILYNNIDLESGNPSKEKYVKVIDMSTNKDVFLGKMNSNILESQWREDYHLIKNK
ncbi:hypothetical protein [Clostridium senegalense]|uniref:Uncharacterized protein n=1 Tax=Clostridium senegalense TaxID=1465809 RepID=A0A6M0H8G4_9CLOT|nr:hypothetical protein [Clostridium senegalense]NEU06141.1 hypothetical protein [Clostridium senegalense]